MQIPSSQKILTGEKTSKKDKNVPVKKSKILYQFMTAATAMHYPAKSPKHSL